VVPPLVTPKYGIVPVHVEVDVQLNADVVVEYVFKYSE
jgi:hypothetical protein